MGIKYLNTYIRNNVCNRQLELHLKDLQYKTIVVDISIYMYKFKGENNLIPGLYQMVSLFNYYNIKSIFVFDGKPPKEKHDVLVERYHRRKQAEKEHAILSREKNETVHHYERLRELERKMTRLTRLDTENAKRLLGLCGATVVQAEGEADQICALYVIKGKAYACLSEDTDMFVYGCPRVLKCMNLLYCTVKLYNLKHILRNMHISIDEFKDICILADNEHVCVNQKTLSISHVVVLFNTYKNVKGGQSGQSSQNFHDYLHEKNIITDMDSIDNAKKNYTLNDADIDRCCVDTPNDIVVFNKKTRVKLHEFLKSYNFIFTKNNRKKQNLM